jgi:multidrug resistance efflux pump
MAYYLFKDTIWITAPGIVTSYPVTITANFDGVVATVPLRVGDNIELQQPLFTLQNRTLDREILFLEQELQKLDVKQEASFETYEQAIKQSKTNLNQIEEIKDKFAIYHTDGDLSDIDYANILNQSNAAQNSLSSQQILLDQAKYSYQERLIAGVITQAKRALQKELVLKLDQQASLILSSPFTGRVVDIPATEGNMVVKGDPLITIARNLKPSVVAYLDPKYLAEAKLGKQVNIKFPDGKIYKATVSQEIEIVSQLPNQLVKPFEGQPSFLKVAISIDDELESNYWIEGITVEVIF